MKPKRRQKVSRGLPGFGKDRTSGRWYIRATLADGTRKRFTLPGDLAEHVAERALREQIRPYLTPDALRLLDLYAASRGAIGPKIGPKR